MSDQLKDIFSELAAESGIVTDPQHEEYATVGDLVDSYRRDSMDDDSFDHAAKARHVADQLEDLAEKADEIADEDERYAQVAMEAYRGQFDLMMQNLNQDVTAVSFESALTGKEQAHGLARDARFQANRLNMAVDYFEDFSPEGLFSGMFTSKEENMDKILGTLKGEFTKVKQKQAKIQAKGVVLANENLAVFLTRGGGVEEVHDMAKGIDEDLTFIGKVDDTVQTLLSEMERTVKDPEVGYKRTDLSGLVKSDLMNLKSFGPDEGYQFFTGKKTVSGKSLAWAAVKGLVGGAAGSLVAGLITSAIPVFGPVSAFARGFAFGHFGMKTFAKSVDEDYSKMKGTQVADIASLQKSIDQLEKMGRSYDSKALANRLDAIKSGMSNVDKDTKKRMQSDIDFIRKATTFAYDHVFLLAAGVGHMMEYVDKKVD